MLKLSRSLTPDEFCVSYFERGVISIAVADLRCDIVAATLPSFRRRSCAFDNDDNAMDNLGYDG